jgi:hypothetical protein
VVDVTPASSQPVLPASGRYNLPISFSFLLSSKFKKNIKVEKSIL